jgi:hypothetical protein
MCWIAASCLVAIVPSAATGPNAADDVAGFIAVDDAPPPSDAQGDIPVSAADGVSNLARAEGGWYDSVPSRPVQRCEPGEGPKIFVDGAPAELGVPLRRETAQNTIRVAIQRIPTFFGYSVEWLEGGAKRAGIVGLEGAAPVDIPLTMSGRSHIIVRGGESPCYGVIPVDVE